MKKVLSLLFVALCGLTAWGADVTFDASVDKGKLGSNDTQGEETITKEGVTISCTIGRWNLTDQYRIMKNSVFTVSSDRTITKVVFNCTAEGEAQYGPGNFTDATAGAYTFEGKVGTWTGSATNFSMTASKAQVRVNSIVVTVAGEATSIDVPKFNPAGGTYYEAQNVEITAVEGATIYYTTNGADPMQTDEIYAGPITVDKNMTIKAVAAKGNLVSSVATAEYVIAQVNTVSNIAAYVALGTGGYAAIANPVTVFYSNGNTVWVKDDSGILCIYGKVAGNMNYKNGDIIPGGFGGYLKQYNGGPEMTYNGDQDLFGFKAATAGEAVEPEEARAAGVTANIWGHYVVIKNAKVSDVSGKNFTITDASGNLAGYNSYSQTIPTDDAAYNITGIVATYTKDDNTTVQLMPTAFEKIVNIDDLPVLDNIAALLAKVGDGNDYRLRLPVTVVAHSGQQLYIMDDSGFARVYGSLANTYKNGDVLEGIAGNVTLRYGMTQINPIAASFGEALEGSEVEPEVLPIEEVAQGDVHKYLKFEEVTLTAVTKTDGTTDTRNITMSDDTGELLVYLNGFGVVYPESLEGTFDVTGFVVVYKKNDETDAILELYPTEIKQHGDTPQPLQGDVDGNNVVNGSDVTALYNYLLNGVMPNGNADVDGNGTINGSDVTALYNILLAQ